MTANNNLEIERKWVLTGINIPQGYLPKKYWHLVAAEDCLHPEAIEVRIGQDGDRYFITEKGAGTVSRMEVEINISKEFHDVLWPLTEGHRVVKTRVEIPIPGGRTIEVDFFRDRDLILAEVEFDSVEAAESFPTLGKDVTSDQSYKNRNLAK